MRSKTQSPTANEDDVHECLERRRCVRQAEGHDQKFEVAVVRPEGRLFNIRSVDADLMIA
jgi:hypothetical protein